MHYLISFIVFSYKATFPCKLSQVTRFLYKKLFCKLLIEEMWAYTLVQVDDICSMGNNIILLFVLTTSFIKF